MGTSIEALVFGGLIMSGFGTSAQATCAVAFTRDEILAEGRGHGVTQRHMAYMLSVDNGILNMWSRHCDEELILASRP